MLKYLLMYSVDVSPMRQQQLQDDGLSLVGCITHSRSPLQHVMTAVSLIVLCHVQSILENQKLPRM